MCRCGAIVCNIRKAAGLSRGRGINAGAGNASLCRFTTALYSLTRRRILSESGILKLVRHKQAVHYI